MSDTQDELEMIRPIYLHIDDQYFQLYFDGDEIKAEGEPTDLDSLEGELLRSHNMRGLYVRHKSIGNMIDKSNRVTDGTLGDNRLQGRDTYAVIENRDSFSNKSLRLEDYVDIMDLITEQVDLTSYLLKFIMVGESPSVGDLTPGVFLYTHNSGGD
jgi:hypothetical protein